jgi:hypothetical protein
LASREITECASEITVTPTPSERATGKLQRFASWLTSGLQADWQPGR